MNEFEQNIRFHWNKQKKENNNNNNRKQNKNGP